MIASPLVFLVTVFLLALAIPSLGNRCGRQFCRLVPPIVLTYGITMLLAVGGFWAKADRIASARDSLTAVILPALVFTLLLPCDLRAVAGVGTRLLTAFAAATSTIMLGFVLAWLVWRPWLPDDGWQVLAGVAGGWVGGTGNLVAVLAGLQAEADVTGVAVMTDTVCYSIWVLVLFSTAGTATAFNRWTGSRHDGHDDHPPVASPDLSPPLSPGCSPSTIGFITRAGVCLALGIIAGQAAAAVAHRLPRGGPFSEMSWTVLLTTAAGAVAAQTQLGRLPQAKPVAAWLLSVVIVLTATQADLQGLQAAPLFLAVGFTVLVVHAIGMAAIARYLKLDLASCCVASLANIGGVASAPLMAALHAPALAPAAVLLALLGYLIGLPAGLAVATILQRLGGGLSALFVLLCMVNAAYSSEPDRQTADFWIAQCPDADDLLLDSDAVALANQRMAALDPTVRMLRDLPGSYPREDIVHRVTRRSQIPTEPLFHESGRPVSDIDRAEWRTESAVDSIPVDTTVQFGLIVQRTPIRRLPTSTRVFSHPDDTDIDRFQESAVFPGTPVAILHWSAKGHWAFVLTPHYDGWIGKDAIAVGSRELVIGFEATATRFVTGNQVRLAFNPVNPAVSYLALDMGTALPELRNWPQEAVVNGQVATAAHVVQVPYRDRDGSLIIQPALLPRSADSHAGPLPATRANVIRQAFKFLGERYGWGHDYNSRDCSGLVCDVYRSLGLLLPRNTSDQARSPAVYRTPLVSALPYEARRHAVEQTLPGDLIFVPGHVMIVLGHAPDTWVIHAAHGGGQRPPINSIVISRLADLTTDAGVPIIEAATVLVRVFPRG